jgi:hypothetical protein
MRTCKKETVVFKNLAGEHEYTKNFISFYKETDLDFSFECNDTEKSNDSLLTIMINNYCSLNDKDYFSVEEKEYFENEEWIQREEVLQIPAKSERIIHALID